MDGPGVWLEAIGRVRGFGAGDFLVGVDGEEEEIGEDVVHDSVQLAVVIVDVGDVGQPDPDIPGLEPDRSVTDREI